MIRKQLRSKYRPANPRHAADLLLGQELSIIIVVTKILSNVKNTVLGYHQQRYIFMS